MIGVDGVQGDLNPCVVLSDVVSPVHQVVGHYIDEIEGVADGWHGGIDEGEHVPREAGNCG